MKTQEHTPKKWTASIGSRGANIYPDNRHASELTIHCTWDNLPYHSDATKQMDNIEKLIKAVNSHDALVEACKDALKALMVPRIITPEEAIQRIESALKQAKGE